MTASTPERTGKVATYCYQCVAGPDLLKVKVEDGVATAIEPNFDAQGVHPADGRVCVKAFGLIQKAYNPNRVHAPMKRTNPRKGKDEDPGFVEITWDEALDLVAEKLTKVRAEGLLDRAGYPRLAASFGGGGTPTAYMGTFPAFLSAWGPVDLSFGSGQGVKCYHSEHLYGELWHRAFIVCPDTPRTRYIVSFGSNIEASGGVCGVWRHANARVEQGVKRVQIEPHLSVTGGCSAEWVPIKPKTDAAFMHAMIYVLIHENDRERLDVPFLKHMTASGYLVGPNGYYLRDPDTRKPLVWDLTQGKAVPFDTPGNDPALDGRFTASGIEVGPDEAIFRHDGVEVATSFQMLLDHERTFTPEWAETICEVPAATIRRVANEYLDHAEVGATIEIEGRTLPFRPVAVTLGKTVNNGWGGYDCCWARTLLACLVGALDVPGGTIGTAVRLNRPANDRQSSAKPGLDGFMDYPWNPTDKENWISRPQIRNANRTLVPLVANSAWSAALGPTHLAWMQQRHGFENFPEPTQPDVWFFYRTNPVISFWDTPAIADVVAKFPFVVAFAYTHDETNHFADVLLPDCTDLESLQMIRIGGTKYVEQFWDHQGFALRQPAVPAQGEARDFTWIATELARRSGILEKYNQAINRGAAGVPLKGPNYDFTLDPATPHSVETIWDASCRAASAELTEGAEDHGLDWWQEHGFRTIDYPKLQWFLYPHLVDNNMRFELPYQERIFRIGQELGNRLHESGIDWWDRQLLEYQPLPVFHDFSALIKSAVLSNLGGREEDYPFWLLTARSMQYSWGGNVSLQMVREISQNIKGHRGVIMNAGRAAELGIEDGDLVEVRSPLRETRGRVVLLQGIRPDTLLMIGQFDHWITPYAKGFEMPSMNSLVPMLMDLTDATGSAADIVPVSIKRIGGAQ